MNIDPGVLTAIATGVLSVITTVLGIRAASRKQAKENEATMQRLALEQSQHAFSSVREEIDRLRADNDRLRADNDRLTRMVDEVGRDNARMAERLQHIEAELEQERTARLAAEALVEQLRARM